MTTLREILIICAVACALIFFLALLSFEATDSSWTYASDAPIKNLIGIIGAWWADITFLLLGNVALCLPILITIIAIMTWPHRLATLSPVWLRVLGLLLFLFMTASFFSIYLPTVYVALPAGSGGIIGHALGSLLLRWVHITGTTIVLMVGILCGLMLCLPISWFRLVPKLQYYIVSFFLHLGSKKNQKTPVLMTEEEDIPPKWAPLLALKKQENAAPAPKPLKKPAVAMISRSPRPAIGIGEVRIDLELLNPPEHIKGNALSATELQLLSQEVEQRLLDFGLKVDVVGTQPGPVITRFELLPAPGIKASRISNLATDLARSLSVVRVRIVEVIPGKSVIGLEIPNRTRAVVYLKEVLESMAYQQAKSPVSLALGKDIAGNPVVVDLAKMPHLLVAGTTGSGKSVGLNAMLLSLLYKATPAEVRLIMVDPKMLELSIYEGIPHLLTPVVTDMKEAANALRWCVAEMEKRYRLLATQGVRNLAGYNEKISEAKRVGATIAAPEWYQSQVENGELTTLPMIVVVIDEFADMIMVVGKKVEQLIARIAQKARAAGIHLILATQRPSVNVITGLIKANIPTRIAFQVSSKIDSRTILDQQGAQQLLGHGDMLYLAPGAGVPVRVHGAFVADEEVHRVVAAWRQQGEPQYLELGLQRVDTEEEGGSGADGEESGESDPLYDEAVQIVLETRKASISGIQRRLKIGYNRAARLVESMQAAGLVGPMENNGVREILAPSS